MGDAVTVGVEGKGVTEAVATAVEVAQPCTENVYTVVTDGATVIEEVDCPEDQT